MILIGEQGESRLRIVVIGLGSMGKRRIRLLKQIDETIEITGVDTRDDRRHEAETLYGIHTCGELQTAFDRGVTARLSQHRRFLTQCSLISACGRACTYSPN